MSTSLQYLELLHELIILILDFAGVHVCSTAYLVLHRLQGSRCCYILLSLALIVIIRGIMLQCDALLDHKIFYPGIGLQYTTPLALVVS